ncbi:MAG TPA: c-type cytochrome [Rhizomicrobium sp.]|jgi:mono/diheme cytochrome c family protein|nr:c-type cytochrome [Rhizomicrobium sp.]
MRYFARAFVAVALTFGSAPAVLAAGDSEAGAELASKSCSSCHALPAASAGADIAPPFANIARDRKGDRAWVRTWLMNPHPPMKGLNLTRSQIDDIIAYLESLSADEPH